MSIIDRSRTLGCPTTVWSGGLLGGLRFAGDRVAPTRGSHGVQGAVDVQILDRVAGQFAAFAQ